MKAMDQKEMTAMKASSWKIFDRIFKRYDILNRLLSGGFDVYWRRKLAQSLPQEGKQKVLDLATGTGDVVFSIAKHRPKDVQSIMGMDLSENMLTVAREKHDALHSNVPITFSQGDAAHIPLSDASVDVVTISFGIRNVEAYETAFKEMCRVLTPGGSCFVLECSVPQNVIVRFFYLIYFRHILPFVGGLISGDSSAYRYLNRTVETFPQRQALCDAIQRQGLEAVNWTDLTCGTVTLYRARKPV